MNYSLLLALSESGLALDEKTATITEAADDDNDLGADLDTNTDTDDGADTDADNTEEPTDDSNEGGEDESGDDDNSEDNDDDKQEDDDSDDNDSGDDFSMDGDDDDNPDDDPIPDGLTDPDDDGSGDEATDDTETNVHTNVLQLSKLDRTLAKRNCYINFMDLRASISTVRRIIENNEAKIEPEIRSKVSDDLDELHSKITDYIMIKFPVTNYEENLQNYLIFVKEMNDLVDALNPDSDIARENAKQYKAAAKKKKNEEE